MWLVNLRNGTMPVNRGTELDETIMKTGHYCISQGPSMHITRTKQLLRDGRKHRTLTVIGNDARRAE
jgi:hypothetical protein